MSGDASSCLNVRGVCAVHAIGVAGVFALVGCGDSLTPSPDEDRLFDMVSYEGVAVPGVVDSTDHATLEVSGGSFRLNADSTCESSVSHVLTFDSLTSDGTVVLPCSWEDNDTVIAFDWGSLGRSTGRLVADSLRVVHPTGIVCVTTPCPSSWTAGYVRAEAISAR